MTAAPDTVPKWAGGDFIRALQQGYGIVDAKCGRLHLFAGAAPCHCSIRQAPCIGHPTLLLLRLLSALHESLSLARPKAKGCGEALFIHEYIRKLHSFIARTSFILP
ncbi:hypothetical protein Naga_100845g2 [Nannochloropsis gaditana]|uniref:Uncharacterized protein n=1 Tax=Nannochloropsis gaditana TaxID=72520 RepID=W7T632_9STRA|nr:hypothetical protein Naga_100845g2 [Nannochloropsis gaditana]